MKEKMEPVGSYREASWMKSLKERTFDLLKSWCDRMLLDQIQEMDTPYLKGALLCPACSLIHGRCADLILPLTLLYVETREKTYLTSAKHLVEWSEFNLLCEDGTYRNDVGNTWKGISAFSAMAIGETLDRFGTQLDPETKNTWQKIFIRLTDSIGRFFKQDFVKPNINYHAGAAALFALAYRITGKESYRQTAEYWEQICSVCFDAQDLLFGEGGERTHVTEKGCRPIDLGYNIEEALPLLIRHSVWLNDEEKRRRYAGKMLAHLAFLLPDGGIDNSFGTRHNKWTYWGSRTSDGMQEGLVYITDLNPIFARAALKNFELYERCTHDGALYPGLMAYDAGEPACIHHAFTHAKALAVMFLDMREADFNRAKTAILPREKRYGVQSFQSGNLMIVSVGGWRATVNANDFIYIHGAENTGGSLTMLWHERYGAICAATMNRFEKSEPLNMQYQRGRDTYCMTPRIEWNGRSSDCDKTVQLQSGGSEKEAWIVAESTAEPGFRMTYRFFGDTVELSATTGQDGVYHLPVVADRSTRISVSKRIVCFNDLLTVTADRDIEPVCPNETRLYNPVGGFEYFPLKISVQTDETIRISFKISETHRT